MNKTQTIKKATKKTRAQNRKNFWKKLAKFPGNVCRKIWNWLKEINVVGMVNLTLLVAIIVLFSCLISNFMCCKQNAAKNSQDVYLTKNDLVTTFPDPALSKSQTKDTRKVIKRHKVNAMLPVRVNAETNIKPQIRVVGVKKPVVVRELSLPASELPKQNLYGDVIVERHPSSPILSNGVNINGNLFIQNMRKYTLPCDAEINGHLFIRNVEQLKFCGKFIVRGNIYVNRQSSFGTIPGDAIVGGHIVL